MAASTPLRKSASRSPSHANAFAKSRLRLCASCGTLRVRGSCERFWKGLRGIIYRSSELNRCKNTSDVGGVFLFETLKSKLTYEIYSVWPPTRTCSEVKPYNGGVGTPSKPRQI